MRHVLLVLAAVALATWLAWPRRSPASHPAGALQAEGSPASVPAAFDEQATLISPGERGDATSGPPTSRARSAAPLPSASRAPRSPEPPRASAPRRNELPRTEVRFAIELVISAPHIGSVDAETKARVGVEVLGWGATTSGDVVIGDPTTLSATPTRNRMNDRTLPRSVRLVVDHPEASRFEANLPLTRPRMEHSGEDTTTIVWSVSASLAPIRARLVGRATSAQVALVPHEAQRRPGLLPVADLAEVEGGEYSLRVPAPGDWVVVALEPGAHPHYAVVAVQGDVAVVQVAAALRPFPTELHLVARVPEGYEPSGHGLEVFAPLRASSDFEHPMLPTEGPLLTWHEGGAGAAPEAGYGVDLRSGEGKAERADAIVWLRLPATWTSSGEARVRGVATGSVVLRIERPFVPEAVDVLRADTSAGSIAVDLAVSRIDIAGHGADGPLAGGVVTAEVLAPRGRRGGTEGEPPVLPRTATLDAAGLGTLFVPSELALSVAMRHPAGGPTVQRDVVAHGRGERTSLVLKAAPR